MLGPDEQSDYGFFGSAVDIDGDTVVVGTPGDDIYNMPSALVSALSDLSEDGAASRFVKSGTDWAQQAILTVEDSVSLGMSVAIDGNTAIIGDPYRTGRQSKPARSRGCFRPFRYGLDTANRTHATDLFQLC